MDRNAEGLLWAAGAFVAVGFAIAQYGRSHRKTTQRLWATAAVINPVTLVRESCWEVMQRAKHVTINHDKLHELAEVRSCHFIVLQSQQNHLMHRCSRKKVCKRYGKVLNGMNSIGIMSSMRNVAESSHASTSSFSTL